MAVIAMETLDRFLRKVQKPARYTGGEWNSIVKDWRTTDLKVAISYPDTYEVGMSNLGVACLYDIVNQRPNMLCERAYVPWIDMQREMRARGIRNFSLESRRTLDEFDVIGVSLPYELTYTNVLTLLDLGGVPLLRWERTDEHPLVIGGGSGADNPECMADFIDLFVIGEGEETLMELLDLYVEEVFTGERDEAGRPRKRPGWRQAYLERAATLVGVYVPSLYEPRYHDDGAFAGLTPLHPNAQPFIPKKKVFPLPPPLVRPIVPFMEVVHDRTGIELMRGCPRGCRFCQAGYIYRPLRERTPDEVADAVDAMIANTGYEELSLVSLSSADYKWIHVVVPEIVRRHPDVNISLPSLRVDAFSVELANQVYRKKGSLTFAPEAGSQRMRNIINKGITEEEILTAAERAFATGWSGVKLYFMCGLPFETMDDIQGICEIADKVLQIGRERIGKRARVNATVSTFIPKPHSAFQWAAQDTREQLVPKHNHLKRHFPRGAHFSWNEPDASFLEAVLSRGDRKIGPVILHAWRQGCQFDGWSDQFSWDRWLTAFEACGVDPSWYAHRERGRDELFPWDHIGAGASKALLWREWERGRLAWANRRKNRIAKWEWKHRDGDVQPLILHRPEEVRRAAAADAVPAGD